jgi:hypothetical protein
MINIKISEEFLSEIKNFSFDQQVKFLCDKVYEDNKNNNLTESVSNIYLSVQCYDKEGIGGLLRLEREFNKTFVIVYYSEKNNSVKRVQTWEVNLDNPKQVLEMFNEKLKSILEGI